MNSSSFAGDSTAEHASAQEVLKQLWEASGLSLDALDHIALIGSEPVLPSSFAVGVAAQTSIAAAALAAAELWHARTGERQQVAVDMRHAALECCGYFTIDGRVPHIWDKLSGLYPCGDESNRSWVRIHANFAHHRDGALRLLGCPIGSSTERDAVIAALRRWRAEDFEQAAADAGLVVSALRPFETWDRHPQAQAISNLPTLSIERIDDAVPSSLLALQPGGIPLQGVRVLDLTRILAGPVCGRALAAYGADVMLVNSPQLPNIEAIIDTSRGKLSAHIDLQTAEGHATLDRLLQDTHVFIQGYRPGGLEHLGFGLHEVARLRPGIVYVSLSTYGHVGPWANRRGFDSLVQTATGFNHAEAHAAGSTQPKPLPCQMLDYASGYLMAFGAQAALTRQRVEGGSWHVRVSLAQTGRWLRDLGRVANGFAAPKPTFDEFVAAFESGFGKLVALRHPAKFSVTPAHWTRPSMPPGSHSAVWPA